MQRREAIARSRRYAPARAAYEHVSIDGIRSGGLSMTPDFEKIVKEG
jgi:hypothetical protein